MLKNSKDNLALNIIAKAAKHLKRSGVGKRNLVDFISNIHYLLDLMIILK